MYQTRCVLAIFLTKGVARRVQKIFRALLAAVFLGVNSLLVSVGMSAPARAQSICEPSYPIPTDKGTVFYLQRTGNSNTVVYTVNQRADGSINPSKPVDAFWRYFSGSGRKADLRFFEKKVAFGVRIKPLKGQSGKYVANLNAVPHIKVRVEPTKDGKVRAVMPIQGTEARLVCIYVEWRKQAGIIPKILYVDFHGFALDDGRKVVKRLTDLRP